MSKEFIFNQSSAGKISFSEKEAPSKFNDIHIKGNINNKTKLDQNMTIDYDGNMYLYSDLMTHNIHPNSQYFPIDEDNSQITLTVRTKEVYPDQVFPRMDGALVDTEWEGIDSKPKMYSDYNSNSNLDDPMCLLIKTYNERIISNTISFNSHDQNDFDLYVDLDHTTDSTYRFILKHKENFRKYIFNIEDYFVTLKINGYYTYSNKIVSNRGTYFKFTNAGNGVFYFDIDKKYISDEIYPNIDNVIIIFENKYKYDNVTLYFSEVNPYIKPFISYSKMTKTHDDININCRFDLSVVGEFLSYNVETNISNTGINLIDYLQFEPTYITLIPGGYDIISITNKSSSYKYLISLNEINKNVDGIYSLNIYENDDYLEALAYAEGLSEEKNDYLELEVDSNLPDGKFKNGGIYIKPQGTLQIMVKADENYNKDFKHTFNFNFFRYLVESINENESSSVFEEMEDFDPIFNEKFDVSTISVKMIMEIFGDRDSELSYDFTNRDKIYITENSEERFIISANNEINYVIINDRMNSDRIEFIHAGETEISKDVFSKEFNDYLNDTTVYAPDTTGLEDKSIEGMEIGFSAIILNSMILKDPSYLKDISYIPLGTRFGADTKVCVENPINNGTNDDQFIDGFNKAAFIENIIFLIDDKGNEVVSFVDQLNNSKINSGTYQRDLSFTSLNKSLVKIAIIPDYIYNNIFRNLKYNFRATFNNSDQDNRFYFIPASKFLVHSNEDYSSLDLDLPLQSKIFIDVTYQDFTITKYFDVDSDKIVFDFNKVDHFYNVDPYPETRNVENIIDLKIVKSRANADSEIDDDKSNNFSETSKIEITETTISPSAVSINIPSFVYMKMRMHTDDKNFEEIDYFDVVNGSYNITPKGSFANTSKIIITFDNILNFNEEEERFINFESNGNVAIGKNQQGEEITGYSLLENGIPQTVSVKFSNESNPEFAPKNFGKTVLLYSNSVAGWIYFYNNDGNFIERIYFEIPIVAEPIIETSNPNFMKYITTVRNITLDSIKSRNVAVQIIRSTDYDSHNKYKLSKEELFNSDFYYRNAETLEDADSDPLKTVRAKVYNIHTYNMKNIKVLESGIDFSFMELIKDIESFYNPEFELTSDYFEDFIGLRIVARTVYNDERTFYDEVFIDNYQYSDRDVFKNSIDKPKLARLNGSPYYIANIINKDDEYEYRISINDELVEEGTMITTRESSEIMLIRVRLYYRNQNGIKWYYLDGFEGCIDTTRPLVPTLTYNKARLAEDAPPEEKLETRTLWSRYQLFEREKLINIFKNIKDYINSEASVYRFKSIIGSNTDYNYVENLEGLGVYLYSHLSKTFGAFVSLNTNNVELVDSFVLKNDTDKDINVQILPQDSIRDLIDIYTDASVDRIYKNPVEGYEPNYVIPKHNSMKIYIKINKIKLKTWDLWIPGSGGSETLYDNPLNVLEYGAIKTYPKVKVKVQLNTNSNEKSHWIDKDLLAIFNYSFSKSGDKDLYITGKIIRDENGNITDFQPNYSDSVFPQSNINCVRTLLPYYFYEAGSVTAEETLNKFEGYTFDMDLSNTDESLLEYYNNTLYNVVDMDHFNRDYFFKNEIYIDDTLVFDSDTILEDDDDGLIVSHHRLRYLLNNGRHHVLIVTYKFNGTINYKDYYITVLDRTALITKNTLEADAEDDGWVKQYFDLDGDIHMETITDRNIIIPRIDDNADAIYKGEVLTSYFGDVSITDTDANGNFYLFRLTESLRRMFDKMNYIRELKSKIVEKYRKEFSVYTSFIEDRYNKFIELKEIVDPDSSEILTVLNTIKNHYKRFDNAVNYMDSEIEKIERNIEARAMGKEVEGYTKITTHNYGFYTDRSIMNFKELFAYSNSEVPTEINIFSNNNMSGIIDYRLFNYGNRQLFNEDSDYESKDLPDMILAYNYLTPYIDTEFDIINSSYMYNLPINQDIVDKKASVLPKVNNFEVDWHYYSIYDTESEDYSVLFNLVLGEYTIPVYRPYLYNINADMTRGEKTETFTDDTASTIEDFSKFVYNMVKFRPGNYNDSSRGYKPFPIMELQNFASKESDFNYNLRNNPNKYYSTQITRLMKVIDNHVDSYNSYLTIYNDSKEKLYKALLLVNESAFNDYLESLEKVKDKLELKAFYEEALEKVKFNYSLFSSEPISEGITTKLQDYIPEAEYNLTELVTLFSDFAQNYIYDGIKCISVKLKNLMEEIAVNAKITAAVHNEEEVIPDESENEEEVIEASTKTIKLKLEPGYALKLNGVKKYISTFDDNPVQVGGEDLEFTEGKTYYIYDGIIFDHYKGSKYTRMRISGSEKDVNALPIGQHVDGWANYEDILKAVQASYAEKSEEEKQKDETGSILEDLDLENATTEIENEIDVNDSTIERIVEVILDERENFNLNGKAVTLSIKEYMETLKDELTKFRDHFITISNAFTSQDNTSNILRFKHSYPLDGSNTYVSNFVYKDEVFDDNLEFSNYKKIIDTPSDENYIFIPYNSDIFTIDEENIVERTVIDEETGDETVIEETVKSYGFNSYLGFGSSDEENEDSKYDIFNLRDFIGNYSFRNNLTEENNNAFEGGTYNSGLLRATVGTICQILIETGFKDKLMDPILRFTNSEEDVKKFLNDWFNGDGSQFLEIFNTIYSELNKKVYSHFKNNVSGFFKDQLAYNAKNIYGNFEEPINLVKLNRDIDSDLTAALDAYEESIGAGNEQYFAGLKKLKENLYDGILHSIDGEIRVEYHLLTMIFQSFVNLFLYESKVMNTGIDLNNCNLIMLQSVFRKKIEVYDFDNNGKLYSINRDNVFTNPKFFNSTKESLAGLHCKEINVMNSLGFNETQTVWNKTDTPLEMTFNKDKFDNISTIHLSVREMVSILLNFMHNYDDSDVNCYEKYKDVFKPISMKLNDVMNNHKILPEMVLIDDLPLKDLDIKIYKYIFGSNNNIEIQNGLIEINDVKGQLYEINHYDTNYSKLVINTNLLKTSEIYRRYKSSDGKNKLLVVMSISNKSKVQKYKFDLIVQDVEEVFDVTADKLEFDGREIKYFDIRNDSPFPKYFKVSLLRNSDVDIYCSDEEYDYVVTNFLSYHIPKNVRSSERLSVDKVGPDPEFLILENFDFNAENAFIYKLASIDNPNSMIGNSEDIIIGKIDANSTSRIYIKSKFKKYNLYETTSNPDGSEIEEKFIIPSMNFKLNVTVSSYLDRLSYIEFFGDSNCFRVEDKLSVPRIINTKQIDVFAGYPSLVKVNDLNGRDYNAGKFFFEDDTKLNNLLPITNTSDSAYFIEGKSVITNVQSSIANKPQKIVFEESQMIDDDNYHTAYEKVLVQRRVTESSEDLDILGERTMKNILTNRRIKPSGIFTSIKPNLVYLKLWLEDESLVVKERVTKNYKNNNPRYKLSLVVNKLNKSLMNITATPDKIEYYPNKIPFSKNSFEIENSDNLENTDKIVRPDSIISSTSFELTTEFATEAYIKNKPLLRNGIVSSLYSPIHYNDKNYGKYDFQVYYMNATACNSLNTYGEFIDLGNELRPAEFFAEYTKSHRDNDGYYADEYNKLCNILPDNSQVSEINAPYCGALYEYRFKMYNYFNVYIPYIDFEELNKHFFVFRNEKLDGNFESQVRIRDLKDPDIFKHIDNLTIGYYKDTINGNHSAKSLLYGSKIYYIVGFDTGSSLIDNATINTKFINYLVLPFKNYKWDYPVLDYSETNDPTDNQLKDYMNQFYKSYSTKLVNDLVFKLDDVLEEETKDLRLLNMRIGAIIGNIDTNLKAISSRLNTKLSVSDFRNWIEYQSDISSTLIYGINSFFSDVYNYIQPIDFTGTTLSISNVEYDSIPSAGLTVTMNVLDVRPIAKDLDPSYGNDYVQTIFPFNNEIIPNQSTIKLYHALRRYNVDKYNFVEHLIRNNSDTIE